MDSQVQVGPHAPASPGGQSAQFSTKQGRKPADLDSLPGGGTSLHTSNQIKFVLRCYNILRVKYRLIEIDNSLHISVNSSKWSVAAGRGVDRHNALLVLLCFNQNMMIG